MSGTVWELVYERLQATEPEGWLEPVGNKVLPGSRRKAKDSS